MAPKPKVPDGYDSSFLDCRTFGHQWAVAESFPEGTLTFVMSLSCKSCGTRRNDRVALRTGQVTRNYEYPDGYRTDYVPRTTYRLEFIRAIRHER